MKTLSIRVVSGRIISLPETVVAAGTKPQYKTIQLKLRAYLRFIFTMSPRVVSFFM